ncbi:hypothetical protein [Vibrio sp. OPT18]|uniref:hypothetical protein n=1 Tax=Vibrio sp. OPT18 TaxID=2778641 RepID=UPI001881B0C5|nr:hypothetical protein [Vibrio sp. OPT18]MBE8577823.1 hypothetical protein [Vibrio sp. OPT18]
MKRFFKADFSKDCLTSLLPVFLMLVFIYITQNMFFNISVSNSYVESKQNVFEVSHNLPNVKKLSDEEKIMIYDNADLALNVFMNVSTNQSSNNNNE